MIGFKLALDRARGEVTPPSGWSTSNEASPLGPWGYAGHVFEAINRRSGVRILHPRQIRDLVRR